MSKNVIDDKYTRDGYIAPVERLHDELVFRYRPMLPEFVEDLEQSIEKKSPKDATLLVAKAVARQLIEWSELDASGKPLPFEFENVRRLPYLMLVRLRRIVTGQIASDLRPDATSAETSDYIKALEAGPQPGLQMLAADQKN